jgi:soluble lytic murein transglycosylase-like protein
LSFLRKTTDARQRRSRVSLSSFAVGSCAATSQHGGAPASVECPCRRVSVLPIARLLSPLRSIVVTISVAAALFSTAPQAIGSARAEPAISASPTSSSTLFPFAAFIAEASQRFAIPSNWIRAVIWIESGARPYAVSPKGAMGLMQIMPKTYAGLRTRYHLGPNAYDPRDNILAGVAYLREMQNRFGSPGFLAAYNAGPDRYERHLATGGPLPLETQDYVAMLMPIIEGRRAESKPAAASNLFAWLRSALFVPHGNVAPSASRPPFKSPPDQHPTIRRVVDLSALAPRSDGLFVRLAERTGAQ